MENEIALLLSPFTVSLISNFTIVDIWNLCNSEVMGYNPVPWIITQINLSASKGASLL